MTEQGVFGVFFFSFLGIWNLVLDALVIRRHVNSYWELWTVIRVLARYLVMTENLSKFCIECPPSAMHRDPF